MPSSMPLRKHKAPPSTAGGCYPGRPTGLRPRPTAAHNLPSPAHGHPAVASWSQGVLRSSSPHACKGLFPPTQLS